MLEGIRVLDRSRVDKTVTSRLSELGFTTTEIERLAAAGVVALASEEARA